MTQDNPAGMPDEVWLGWNSGWNCAEHKLDGYGTKYLRAEPVLEDIRKLREELINIERFVRNYRFISHADKIQQTLAATAKYAEKKME